MIIGLNFVLILMDLDLDIGFANDLDFDGLQFDMKLTFTDFI